MEGFELDLIETSLIEKRNEAGKKLSDYLRSLSGSNKGGRLVSRTIAHLQYQVRMACEALDEFREQYR